MKAESARRRAESARVKVESARRNLEKIKFLSVTASRLEQVWSRLGCSRSRLELQWSRLDCSSYLQKCHSAFYFSTKTLSSILIYKILESHEIYNIKVVDLCLRFPYKLESAKSELK